MSTAQNILNLNPSLVLIPSTGKAGELDSIIPQDGTGDFTVSRNGNATFFDKDGILRTALPNQPRFDFDPLTGQFRGVLVEPAATNVLINSAQLQLQTHQDVSGSLTTLKQGLFWRVNNQQQSALAVAYSRLTFPAIQISNPIGTAILTSGIVELKGGQFISLPTAGGTGINSSISLINTYSNGLLRNLLISSNNISNWDYQITLIGQNKYQFFTRVVLTANNGLFSFTNISVGNYLNNGETYDNEYSNLNVIIGNSSIIPTSFIPTFGSQVTRPADQITVTVPMGATQCVYVLNGTQVTVPVTGGSTFTLPNGRITQLYMI